MDDAELLRSYAATHSESAFREFVRRHIDFVYSAASRQTGGDHHRAEEVAQLVFTDVARKAAPLSRHPALVAWLHRSTRYAASSLRRQNARQTALADSLAYEPSMNTEEQNRAAEWECLRPVLDAALDELSETDRAAVILRFFAGRPFAEVGERLGLTENAARMRVERALDKLHALLARRGITSTSAALGVVLSANAVTATPTALGAAIAGTAIAVSPAAGSALAAFFAMTKIQVGILGIIILAGAVPLIKEVQAQRRLNADFSTLRRANTDLAELQKENATLTAALHDESGKNSEIDELIRARARIGQLKNRPDGVVDSEMRPVGNLGRATPEAAYATFLDAISAGDLDAVAALISFRDGATQEQKDVFMAKFSDVIRARYRTPERLMAAAYIGVREGRRLENPAAAFQKVSSEELFPGFVQVRIWVQDAAGNGSELKDTFQQVADGWALVVRPIADERTVALVRSRLDPATGELLELKN